MDVSVIFQGDPSYLSYLLASCDTKASPLSPITVEVQEPLATRLIFAGDKILCSLFNLLQDLGFGFFRHSFLALADIVDANELSVHVVFVKLRLRFHNKYAQNREISYEISDKFY